MKYIRTTDGRIINTQDERGNLIGESIVKVNNSLIVIRNNKGDELIPVKDIIKQANTIEELCDEFVECYDIIEKALREWEIWKDAL